MTGNGALGILDAKINSKHLGPTYTKDEIDAKVREINTKLDSIEDGNEEEY